MDKCHEVAHIMLKDNLLLLTVDGKDYELDLAQHSSRLASATDAQRSNFSLSPSGYGIHWSELDEDLSIDGLIGIGHTPPTMKRQAS